MNNGNVYYYPHHLNFSDKKTPVNKLFHSIYFNEINPLNNKNALSYNAYDTNKDHGIDVYSKKKVKLINDYNMLIKKRSEEQFRREELIRRQYEQEKSEKYLEDIQREISPSKTKFYEYNKRYEPRTIFDERKSLYNSALNNGNYPHPYPYPKLYQAIHTNRKNLYDNNRIVPQVYTIK